MKELLTGFEPAETTCEGTLHYGISCIKTEVTGEKRNRAWYTGIEPDSLADFTTSLFLP